MRKIAIALTALAFLSSAALGFMSDPAIGGGGIPFDPTVIPGVDARIWFGPESRCAEFTYCTIVLQSWMIR